MTSIQPHIRPVESSINSNRTPLRREFSLREMNAFVQAEGSELKDRATEWSSLLHGNEQRHLLMQMLDADRFDVEDLEALGVLSQEVKRKIDERSVTHSPNRFIANLFKHRLSELREIEAKIERAIIHQRIIWICRYLSSKPDLLSSEGVFRIAGNASEINEWLEGKGYNLDALAGNVHNVVCVLKQFIGKVPSMNEKFPSQVDVCVDEEGKVKAPEIKEFRDHLFDDSLFYCELFSLLNKIVKLEKVNKMGVENLRICLIPRLIVHEDPMTSLKLIESWAPIIDWLIKHPGIKKSVVSTL